MSLVHSTFKSLCVSFLTCEKKFQIRDSNWLVFDFVIVGVCKDTYQGGSLIIVTLSSTKWKLIFHAYCVTLCVRQLQIISRPGVLLKADTIFYCFVFLFQNFFPNCQFLQFFQPQLSVWNKISVRSFFSCNTIF